MYSKGVFRFKKSFFEEEGFEKALSHKYIKCIPKITGIKDGNYIYKETFQKPIKTFVEFFGIYEKRINNDYEKHNIQKEYGAVKRLSYPTFFLSKMLL